MPGIDERIDADLNQLRRTADWLRLLPQPRLAADDRRIGRRGASLVLGVDSLTRQVCANSADQERCEECPPPHATPHRLGDDALGVQLAVFTDQLARVLHRCTEDVDVPAVDAALRELAQEALALRSGGPFG
jgi:hypothetical protein